MKVVEQMWVKMSFSFIIIFIFISCGENSKTSKTTGSVETFSDKPELLRAINRSSVKCANQSESHCPSNIGKLLVWNSEFVQPALGVCSGTLLDQEHFITNSHCVELIRKSWSKDCRNYAQIELPENETYPSEKLKCLEILEYHEDFKKYLITQDIAILKIEKPQRLILPVNFSSTLDNNEKLISYTMNPEYDITQGTIVRKEFKSNLENLLFLNQNPKSMTKLINSKSAEVISGNSGSALFNEENKIVGVLFARVSRSYFDLSLTVFNLANFKHWSELDSMGFFVNIYCSEFLFGSSSGNCNKNKDNKINDINYFFQHIKVSQKLDYVDDSKINVKVNSNLSIEMSLKALPESKKLTDFKENFPQFYNSIFKTYEKELIEFVDFY